jgi:hypothetical protein
MGISVLALRLPRCCRKDRQSELDRLPIQFVAVTETESLLATDPAPPDKLAFTRWREDTMISKQFQQQNDRMWHKQSSMSIYWRQLIDFPLTFDRRPVNYRRGTRQEGFTRIICLERLLFWP